MLEFTDIALGAGPVVRCARCHPGTAVAESYRPAAEVAEALRAAVDGWGSPLPGPNVSLGGAEPFGHPELPDVIAEAVRAGVARIRLETDAAALTVAGNASGCLASGVRHVRSCVLGPSDVHDSLVGAPGALGRTVAGLVALRDAADRDAIPVHVSVRVPVCRHTRSHLPSAVTVAAEARAAEVVLAVDDPGLDLARALPWLEAACDTGTVNSVWTSIEGVPYCLAPGLELHLAATQRRSSEGAKSPRCAECALDDACPGGIENAEAGVTAAFAPPADAGALAVRVAAGFAAPGAGEA